MRNVPQVWAIPDAREAAEECSLQMIVVLLTESVTGVSTGGMIVVMYGGEVRTNRSAMCLLSVIVA